MVATREVPIETLIERTPGVNGGRPCLAGTGFSIQQLSVLYSEGARADEILRRYPYLDLPRIYAGIAYYLANREWIDAEVAAESEAYRVEAARRKQATG